MLSHGDRHDYRNIFCQWNGTEEFGGTKGLVAPTKNTDILYENNTLSNVANTINYHQSLTVFDTFFSTTKFEISIYVYMHIFYVLKRVS